MSRGKLRPGRRVHVHRGDCRCRKHVVGSHKHSREGKRPESAEILWRLAAEREEARR